MKIVGQIFLIMSFLEIIALSVASAFDRTEYVNLGNHFIGFLGEYGLGWFVIGEVGLGFYQSAYAFYTIVLLISSYSMPSAISKVIAQKLAVKEYKNAHRIFLCALI